MAKYVRKAAPIDAHPLGATKPPTWYTEAIESGTIAAKPGLTDFLVGTKNGWTPAFVGDMVIRYTEEVETPDGPKSVAFLDVLTPDVFASKYESSK
jgi:hypothetical protein